MGYWVGGWALIELIRDIITSRSLITGLAINVNTNLQPQALSMAKAIHSPPSTLATGLPMASIHSIHGLETCQWYLFTQCTGYRPANVIYSLNTLATCTGMPLTHSHYIHANGISPLNTLATGKLLAPSRYIPANGDLSTHYTGYWEAIDAF